MSAELQSAVTEQSHRRTSLRWQALAAGTTQTSATNEADLTHVRTLQGADMIFRLDALAWSVIATATWLGGWLGGCHTPVLYQNC